MCGVLLGLSSAVRVCQTWDVWSSGADLEQPEHGNAQHAIARLWLSH